MLSVCSLFPSWGNQPMDKEIVAQSYNKRPRVPYCQKSDSREHATITIFIHGSRIFPKFYYQEVYYSPEGLTKVSDIDTAFHMHTIAKTLENADPKRFNTDSFYAFGWDGKLSFEGRAKAAQDLYDALKTLIADFKAIYGFEPQIRLITHSHGGNVALNLAPVVKNARDDSFHIKELILLAVPCQDATKDYAADHTFEKVYSLSSKFDMIQVVDPQGLYNFKVESIRPDSIPLFSERYLVSHPRILQARIKMFGRYILHLEFLMRKSFLSKLPVILDEIDRWYHLNGQSHKLLNDIPTVNIKRQDVDIMPKFSSHP